MPDVKILVPANQGFKIAAFLARPRQGLLEPFAPSRLAALDSLSKAILEDTMLRRDAAAASLAFWLRRANLAALESDFRAQASSLRRVPAGLVFHIAPANVDTMFVYSWSLSFLCGNANVVRLTSNSSQLMEILLSCLNGAFAANGGGCAGNVFLTYDHDDEITTRLSMACDTRVVWGGDETVLRIRALPLKPSASERSFASKRSLSVIVAASYLGATEEARVQLADRMAVDLVPFGQMACSSPQTLLWVGDKKVCAEALSEFGPRLEAAMAEKQGEPDLGWAVRRMNFSFGEVAAGIASGVVHRAHSTQVAVANPGLAVARPQCGVGLLYNSMVSDFNEVAAVVGTEHQTITYFGLTNRERDELAMSAGRAGVDRLVPVGRALDFGPSWDGYNLWDDFTRIVTVA